MKTTILSIIFGLSTLTAASALAADKTLACERDMGNSQFSLTVQYTEQADNAVSGTFEYVADWNGTFPTRDYYTGSCYRSS